MAESKSPQIKLDMFIPENSGMNHHGESSANNGFDGVSSETVVMVPSNTTLIDALDLGAKSMG